MRKKHLMLSTILSMTICSSWNPSVMAMDETVLEIDKTVVSQNFRSRGGQKPQVLLLHCVGLSDEWVFKNYVYKSDSTLPEEKKGLGVSAHYYIPQGGKIYQMVPEEESAFHAGVSEWRSLAQKNNAKGLNDFSIGIEFQSLGYAQINGQAYYPYSFTPFHEEQMKSGILLSQQIMKRHNIAAENVVWHSDVSPLRKDGDKALFGKTDPGAMFDGKRLAQHGIGVWPVPDRLTDSQLSFSLEDIQVGLTEWGYPHVTKIGFWDESTKYVLQSHYMHYLPKEVNWDNFKYQTSGSIFDKITDWKEFPYDKDTLAISLQNLNKKKFIKPLE